MACDKMNARTHGELRSSRNKIRELNRKYKGLLPGADGIENASDAGRNLEYTRTH